MSLTATNIVSNTPRFTNFDYQDASGDSSSRVVFSGGAIKFSYSLANTNSLSSVGLQAIRSGRVVANLGTWRNSSLSNQLVNLASFSSLTAGSYQLRAVARTSSGQSTSSVVRSLDIRSLGRVSGTFKGETLNYSATSGTGTLVSGRGGTDILNLVNISQSDIVSLNGASLSSFNSYDSTNRQAIFGGTAWDYLTLRDGREVYFQGIENIRFSNGSKLRLHIRTNDTHFANQWNLNVSDVTSAWRFTHGSSNVLLVSLDSGILTAQGSSGGIFDINTNRLSLDPTDDDNGDDNSIYYGHGHKAISVMASTGNNRSGIAGINWNSPVMVHDVYGSSGSSRVSLQNAIRNTMSYARSRGLKVVFQGGIQGEPWLTNGGSRTQLEQLVRDNRDIALFAVAAGNGGPGGNLRDPNYSTSVSGVAKLQTNHNNVISVGALQSTRITSINGLRNAGTVGLASYSNRGSNLTLVAATDSPAIDKFGNMGYFSGTSAANPNMAGIASLVWSVNASLSASKVRQILTETSMDIGSVGRDNTYGHGLVNADAAVRRAAALARNYAVANLYQGRSVIV